jgi:hypothetical protein
MTTDDAQVFTSSHQAACGRPDPGRRARQRLARGVGRRAVTRSWPQRASSETSTPHACTPIWQCLRQSAGGISFRRQAPKSSLEGVSAVAALAQSALSRSSSDRREMRSIAWTRPPSQPRQPLMAAEAASTTTTASSRRRSCRRPCRRPWPTTSRRRSPRRPPQLHPTRRRARALSRRRSAPRARRRSHAGDPSCGRGARRPAGARGRGWESEARRVSRLVARQEVPYPLAGYEEEKALTGRARTSRP